MTDDHRKLPNTSLRQKNEYLIFGLKNLLSLAFLIFLQTRSSLLKVDNVGHVLDESPAKLANSILLFCKGLGWLTSVDLPGVERRCSSDSNVSRKGFCQNFTISHSDICIMNQGERKLQKPLKQKYQNWRNNFQMQNLTYGIWNCFLQKSSLQSTF